MQQEGLHWEQESQHQQWAQHSTCPALVWQWSSAHTQSSEKALATSHSFNLPEPKLINLPSSPAKGTANPDDGVAVEASGSTGDCDRDSAVEVSKDDVDEGGDGSDSGSDSWESTADSGPDSAMGNCLMCLDTKEIAVKSACKKFQKKVHASCSIAKGCPWMDAQLGQIGDSHQTVWGSDYEAVKTKQDIALKGDHSSFEVSKVTDWTDQLLRIKEATHIKIYYHKHEAEVHGRKKTLAQSLKQFHTCFYWLYKKVMTHAMVSYRACIQAMLSDALTFLPVWGWSHSAPGALNYVGILKQLSSTSWRYTIGWQLCVIYAEHLLTWPHRAS